MEEDDQFEFPVELDLTAALQVGPGSPPIAFSRQCRLPAAGVRVRTGPPAAGRP